MNNSTMSFNYMNLKMKDYYEKQKANLEYLKKADEDSFNNDTIEMQFKKF